MESSESRSVGIIGLAPSGLTGLLRVKRARELFAHAGELEQAPGFWAGHATVHALMNGVPRVHFWGVPEWSGAALSAAVEGLLSSAPRLPLLVAPGLVDEHLQASLCSSLHAHHWETSLFVDAPKGANLGEIVERASALPGGASLAAPWVKSISPGLNLYLELPPTSLLSPLWLGTRTTLRGVHELPPFSLVEARQLQRAGVRHFEVRGVRRLVGLSGPPKERRPAPVEPPISPYEAAVREACEGLDAPASPALCRTIERRAKAALKPFLDRGDLTQAIVSAVQEEGGVVVNIWLKAPRLVRELVVKLGAID